jgi:hypothetical protein
MRNQPLSEYTLHIQSSRAAIQRVFFVLALAGLIMNFLNHTGLYQIGGNPLLYADLDPLYWLAIFLKVPALLTGFPALVFDILLTLTCALSAIHAGKKMWPVCFLILYYLYFLVYNMRTGHHYTNPAILIMGMAFVVNSPKRFAALFTLARLIFCFMMFSAAIWKITRGNLIHPEHARYLLISLNLESLVTGNPSHRIEFISSLIAIPWMPQLLWILLILIELSFVTGLLTLRFDKILLVAYLLFFAGGWLLFDIYIYENLLFLLTLSPFVGLLNTRTFAR